MRSREAIKRAQKKYEKIAIRRIILKLHKANDKSIIDHLENQENMTGYIKALIKADMEKGVE